MINNSTLNGEQAKFKNIAVVGGGIFGVTTAVKLANNGHRVDLFEKEGDILQAASGINQYRLHRGYHYPRSKDTTISSLKTEPKFRKEYAEAIIDNDEYYYCIAKEHSLISAEDYLKFCQEHNLEYSLADPGVVQKNKIELAIRVREGLIDPVKLRTLCWQKLRDSGVKVFLKTETSAVKLRHYDFVVICTYAVINSLLTDFPYAQKDYQFELCEKLVLKLPKSFYKKSIVVMDGPFMCIDPLANTDLHLMGNVVHAIHQTNIGKHPIIDVRYRPLLNRGIINNPPITNIKKFIESAAEFMPEITKAEHVGSMFTIRTVLPYQDKTDTRPTLVEAIDGRTFVVFSGKLSNCVDAAEKISGMIDSSL